MRHTPMILGYFAAVSLAVAQAPSRAPQALRHMHHTVWGPEDGLPLTASTVIQTPDGYLWLPAPGGLVRFDGVRFTRIDSTITPTFRVATSEPFKPLLVDREGTLWIARPDNTVITYRDGRFRVAFKSDGNAPIYSMAQDHSGKVWVLAGLVLRELRDGRLQRPRLPAGVPDTAVLTVVADTGNGVWIGTRHGLWHVSGGASRSYASPDSMDKAVRPFLQTDDGKLWAGSRSLQVLEGDQWTTPAVTRQTGSAASTVVEAAEQGLLIGTQGMGLFRVHDGRTEHYTKSDGLSDVQVRTVLRDREGDIWVLTDAGLDRFHTAPFTTLGTADDVPFESPLTIAADEDRGFWVTSYGDHRIYHATNGIADHDTGRVHWEPATFPHADAHIVVQSARGGGVWVYSDSDGVRKFRHGSLSSGVSPSMLRRWYVEGFLEDTSGTVWLGLTGHKTPGLTRMRRTDYRTVALMHPDSMPRAPSSLVLDGRGHVWANDLDGPMLYELDGDTVVWRTTFPVTQREIAVVIVAEGGDTLWFASWRNMYRLVGHSLAMLDIPALEPVLATGSTNLMVRDKSLWIGTSSGVVRMSLADAHRYADGRGPRPVLRFFSAADGLGTGRLTSYNSWAMFGATDGRLWLSTPGGLAVYDPAHDDVNRVPPLAHVEEVVADGRLVSKDSGVAIPPQPARVEIHFTATSLRIPQRVRLEYMLEGADRSWIPAGPQRVATYTQLRPARYRFRVRAWNEDGIPSASEAALALSVAPTWYQASMFRGFMVVLLIGGGPLVVYSVLRERAKQREAQLHARFDAALDERTRVARELHDTLLQGFTGVTLQLQAVQHSLEEAPQLASGRLTKVLSLADETLREARQAIWDMRAPELGDHDLPGALEGAAQTAIGGAPIALHFGVRGHPRRLPPVIESTVLRIGREALVNAVRHASPTDIQVDLVYADQRVECHVRDDGSGFDSHAATAARERGHWGVPGMRERAARAGGVFEITGAPGRGTSVSLSLPTGS